MIERNYGNSSLGKIITQQRVIENVYNFRPLSERSDVILSILEEQCHRVVTRTFLTFRTYRGLKLEISDDERWKAIYGVSSLVNISDLVFEEQNGRRRQA